MTQVFGKKFVWFESSKGPEDMQGFDLRFLDADARGTNGYSTPSFGWWQSFNHYMMGIEAVMGYRTKDNLAKHYEFVWLKWRPSKDEALELLNIIELEIVEDGK